MCGVMQVLTYCSSADQSAGIAALACAHAPCGRSGRSYNVGCLQVLSTASASRSPVDAEQFAHLVLVGV